MVAIEEGGSSQEHGYVERILVKTSQMSTRLNGDSAGTRDFNTLLKDLLPLLIVIGRGQGMKRMTCKCNGLVD